MNVNPRGGNNLSAASPDEETALLTREADAPASKTYLEVVIERLSTEIKRMREIVQDPRIALHGTLSADLKQSKITLNQETLDRIQSEILNNVHTLEALRFPRTCIKANKLSVQTAKMSQEDTMQMSVSRSLDNIRTLYESLLKDMAKAEASSKSASSSSAPPVASGAASTSNVGQDRKGKRSIFNLIQQWEQDPQRKKQEEEQKKAEAERDEKVDEFFKATTAVLVSLTKTIKDVTAGHGKTAKDLAKHGWGSAGHMTSTFSFITGHIMMSISIYLLIVYGYKGKVFAEAVIAAIFTDGTSTTGRGAAR